MSSVFEHCLACFASSVDGKITAPSTAQNPDAWVKLGTAKDLARLFTLRNTADVICFGASTFRAWPSVRRGLIHQENQALMHPCHVLFTMSWHLDWQAPLFKEWAVHQALWGPLFIASSSPAPLDLPTEVRAFLQVIALDIHTSERHQLQQVKAAVDPFLAGKDSPTWMLEGGGQLFEFFLKATAVDTLHLTLTPQLIGGLHTPSLVSGSGFLPQAWPTVTWTDIEHHAPELYLTGAIQYAP